MKHRIRRGVASPQAQRGAPSREGQSGVSPGEVRPGVAPRKDRRRVVPRKGRRGRISLRKGLLSTTVVASLAYGGTYTWVGGGADDKFNTCANWTYVNGTLCHPSETSDHATVSGVYDVDLVKVSGDDVEMGNLTVEDGVIFGDGDSSDPTLYVEGLTIDGVSGGTTIKITKKATIESD